ncbi:hypothetical protein TNCV_642511 [Trichonephila clavipes]|nr:hypothetical protein TNCV_642511 [Trichonephila clavipes]
MVDFRPCTPPFCVLYCIRLNVSDCEEYEESADEIDNIPVNPYIYVARDGSKWILNSSNVLERFVTQNVLRQSSGQQAS